MMENRIVRLVFHLFCYYTAWFSCILFAKNNDYLTGPIIVLAILIIQILALYKTIPYKIVYFIIVLMIFGFMVDSFLVYHNYLLLKANPFAPFSSPWMIALWLNFGVIFFDCFYKYFNYYWIWVVLSFFGFPVAFYSGKVLGAASFPNGNIILIYIALLWSIFFPIICFLFSKEKLNR